MNTVSAEANGHFVSLQSVTKRFDDLEVLHGIDLDVELKVGIARCVRQRSEVV